MGINLFLPHFNWRNLTRAKPFLVTKSLKPRLHILLHCQLVRRKRTRLGTVEANTLVKVDLKPILRMWNPKILRIVSGDVTKTKWVVGVKGFTKRKCLKKSSPSRVNEPNQGITEWSWRSPWLRKFSRDVRLEQKRYKKITIERSWDFLLGT